jgi:hypothetical protein
VVSKRIKRQHPGPLHPTGILLTNLSPKPDIGEIYNLTTAMLESLGTRLRFCANEKCKFPAFVRNKRQTFCSPTCRGTVNTRRYRGRKELRQKDPARSD